MPNTGFQEICTTLLYCAEKFEEEMKFDLNEVNNMLSRGNMNDTKISLEKAKEYHYGKIMASIKEIFNQIKLISYHDKKIRWLSDEDHFTKDELKRYSNSQNSQSCMDLSKESDDEPIFLNIKREKRRVASEISIGTLEAWEKYLDQKKDEAMIEKEPAIKEVVHNVPKRTNPDFRRRKKFVSSTLGGFLDEDSRLTQYAIPEEADIQEESEEFSSCEELNNVSLLALNNFENHVNNFNSRTSKTIENNGKINENKIETERNEESTNSISEIATDKDTVQVDKPRIIEVIYKKKPT